MIFNVFYCSRVAKQLNLPVVHNNYQETKIDFAELKNFVYILIFLLYILNSVKYNYSPNANYNVNTFRMS